MDETTRSTPIALRGIVIGLLVALAVVTGFAFHERNAARRLSTQNQQISASLSDTRGQIDALNARLNSLTLPPPAAPAQHEKPAAVVHAPVKRRVVHVQRDDPRWKKFQTQLDEQGKQIDATRQDLASSRTELQGSIAHTHDELVLLEKKGERNYYEFDLDKVKQFQTKGPVGIRLRKANTKHQFADLELMVDDAQLSQKHVNLLQPVVFYSGENGRPVELVINRISKNHIHGYVSEPKYRQSELAATSSADTSATVTPQPANATQAKSRQRLELPRQ